MPTNRIYTPVCGTEEWPSTDGLSWWEPRSRFTAFMKRFGWERHGWSRHGIELPEWSSVLTGTFFSGRDDRTWTYDAEGLAERQEKLPVPERNLICVSHGGQLGVLVAKLLEDHGGINSLTTICTPRRRSMQDDYEAVQCPWLAFYNTNVVTNRMQWLGARGAKWKMPEPALNVRVKGSGHTGLVREPRKFQSVLQEHLIPFLKTANAD